jgi:hypothetical protein
MEEIIGTHWGCHPRQKYNSLIIGNGGSKLKVMGVY